MLTRVGRGVRLGTWVAILSAPLGCSVGFIDDLSDGVAGAPGSGGEGARAGASGNVAAGGVAGAAGRAGGDGRSGMSGVAGSGLGGGAGDGKGGGAGAAGAAGSPGPSAGAGGALVGGAGGARPGGSSGAAGTSQASGAGGTVAGAGGASGSASAGAGGSAGAGAGGGTGATGGAGGSPTCAEGTTRCSGDVRQGCEKGQIVDLETCGANLCTAARCLQCSPETAPSCQGNQPLTCVNGNLVPGPACTADQQCVAGACVSTCNPGSYRCTGPLLQRCNASGGYDDQTTCASGALCNAPAGRCDACDNGTTRCSSSGETFEACTNGTWTFADTCVNGCVAGSGCISLLGPLSAGTEKTCVVADERAICWGNTAHGELGQLGSSSGPHVLPVTSVAAVAIGRAHVCVMRPLASSQEVRVLCAGANDLGQLGRGNTGADDTSFAAVQGLPTAIRALFAAADTTCALDTMGGAWCWGRLIDTQASSATRVNGFGSDVTIMAIGGDDHALYAPSIGPGANGHAFGRNETRQLGFSTAGPPTSFPGSAFLAGSGVRLVAAGGTRSENQRGLGHSCAVDASDQLFCWGLNDDAQTGTLASSTVDLGSDGFHQIVETPQFVTSQVAEIATGPRHTCLRRANVGVSCFGKNDDGRTGPSSSTSATVPLLGEAKSIAVGDNHSCALTSGLGKNRVFCWGANASGQTTANQPADSNPREVILAVP